MSYHEIKECRISGAEDLKTILSLGEMALTGVFPATPDQPVTRGPMSLCISPSSGLVQLRQSYDLKEMYGDNYGYRSGLNRSMVQHLQSKARMLEEQLPIDAESTVLDIGGNDGTLLKGYRTAGMRKFLVDPTAEKWIEHYENTDIQAIIGFFDKAFAKAYGQADIITSISMFYDLEDPNAFVSAVKDTLKPEGVWHFEQSYLPSMLKASAYDTICQEHLEYYTLAVVQRLLEAHNLRILSVTLNDINGGSFAVTACHEHAKHVSDVLGINAIMFEEYRMRLDEPQSYKNFAARVFSHRAKLTSLIRGLNAQGKSVAALGASTKGNVLLQFCGFTQRDIAFVSDVNENKHGCYTPGSLIPIVDEGTAEIYHPDYMLVLPWHFKKGIIEREKNYLKRGGHLIFPLPEITIV